MNVVIAQIIGIFALIFTMISVQQTKKRKILAMQMLSNFSYLAQYVCLRAWAGVAMTSLGLMRTVIFYYYDERNKNKSKLVLVIISFLIILCGVLTYDGILSLLPVVIALAYTVVMWQNNMKIFRILSFVAPICWLIYNVYVSALVATIASIFEFVSAVFAFIRFDIDKNK